MKNLFTSLIIATFLSLVFCLNLTAQSQQYLHFDRTGERDYIEVPNASQYIAGSDQISMAGWFYCDQLAYGQGLMSFRNGGTGDGEMYLIQLNDGALECRIVLGGNLYEVVGGPFTIQAEKWQHIAWVYDGSKVLLYIDGVNKGFAAASGTFESTDTPFSIGEHISPWSFPFGGRVDEVSVWSKALTLAEITDMMENELEGDEADLQLYYKFNQGAPGGDNRSISHAKSEVNAGVGAGDGILQNFALEGDKSNFLGEVDTRFQAISFPLIDNKLISSDDFNLNATVNSGLEVSYEIVSGPATVNGNTVSLNGTAGEVVVRALQSGNADFDPAKEVENSFFVLDPNTNLANVQVRSPRAGIVMVPSLGPIPVSSIATIDFPDLFDVAEVTFKINDDEIQGTLGENGHYTGWWTPPAYGNYTMEVIGTNNYSATNSETISFEVVNSAQNMNVSAGEDVWLNVNIGSEEVEVELPSYQGAFDKIIGTLDIVCPTGGCDEWDRVSSVEVKGHNGVWYEIIRYITPYGVACNHEIDLSDFMSLLHGKVTMRFNLGTQGNGFEYNLNLNYTAGTPTHSYSVINKLWNRTYDFGNMDNLQPVSAIPGQFPDNAITAKIKMVSTGHGWGDNNTGNASEFRESTHHILVDGVAVFTQHNWNECDPNPDDCSPQNGTWFHDRQGWCPGAIAPWFDFDMTPYVKDNFELKYRLDESYVDLCQASNPNCISGVTCPNCNDGFNPELIVSSYLINFADSPIDENIFPVSTDATQLTLEAKIFPNPTEGLLKVQFKELVGAIDLSLSNALGQEVLSKQFNGPIQHIDLNLSAQNVGLYILTINSNKGKLIKKVFIE